jgi:hypothetical protein
MDSFLYKEIIDDHLFPFVAEKFNYKTILHQDNDSKHSSKLCRKSLRDLRIPWVTIYYLTNFSVKIKFSNLRLNPLQNRQI